MGDTVENKKTEDGGNRNLIIGIIAVVAVVAVVLMIGIGNILYILSLIALGNLIYKAVKKQPKKQAVIIFAVLLCLAGVAESMTGASVPEDLLEYLGTPKKQVFKVFDESTFEDYSELVGFESLDNYNAIQKGELNISIMDGFVDALSVDSVSDDSSLPEPIISTDTTRYHVAGVHIGDSESDMLKAMEKSNAVYVSDSMFSYETVSYGGTSVTGYAFEIEYDNRTVCVHFTIVNGLVHQIGCYYS